MKDIEVLARYLINEWGDSVKTDDIPDGLVPVFALQVLQKAKAQLAAKDAVIEAAREVMEFVETQMADPYKGKFTALQVLRNALAALTQKGQTK